MSKSLPVSFALALSLLVQPAASAVPVDSKTIDDLIAESLHSWHVPGAALAIVQNGKIVCIKGFGLRELGSTRPVTPHTIFPIASCTKSFTTLAMAMLADEGKLGWDDPVHKHVDFFRLADPLADANVTLRDLVAHRTGVGQHTLLWYRAPWNLEERIRKIGKVKLARSFRSGLEYQTILFGTAGYAAGKAAGTSWQDLVRQRILVALGMKNVSFTTAPALKAADHASPHKRKPDGAIGVIPWYTIAEPDPAGSINANVRDLARFIQFQLSEGVWEGKRLVSAANVHETHSPQVVVPLKGFTRLMNPGTHQLSYGMGWVIQDYRGKHLLMHGGAIDGFRAHFTLVPEAGLGFVLLNNLHETQMNLAVSNTLVDLFCGLPYKDWNAFYQEIERAELKQAELRPKLVRQRQTPNTKPSLALEAYTGTYTEPAYGPLKITLEDGSLICRWSSFRWKLEHFHFNVFLANDDVLFDAPFNFRLGTFANVEALQALGQEFRKQN